MTCPAIFVEAARLVSTDRPDRYGPAEDNMAGIADVWTGLLRYKLLPGERVSAREVALCLVGMKLQREAYRHTYDNMVDASGYVKIAHDLGEGVLS